MYMLYEYVHNYKIHTLLKEGISSSKCTSNVKAVYMKPSSLIYLSDIPSYDSLIDI